MQKRASIAIIPLLLTLVLAQVHSAFAQQYQGHNWYFGNSPNGIRFSRSDNSATLLNNQRVPFGTGGSSVASDPVNGNLLFYTDGAQVFDATHNLMPNGSGLGANTAGNQPVAIAKAPGPGKRYYIFVNDANNTTGGAISFRIVDLNQLGNAIFPSPALGAGETAGNTAIPALVGRSEAMITVPHANREDFWLITHANGSPDYSVTLVDATGIVSTTNFTGLGLIEVAANFAYHPATGNIAVSPQEARRDIEIVNFDNTNGVLSFSQRALNTGVQSTIGQAIYDTEWSNSGDFLYISRHGETGIQADLLQYDVNNQLNTLASVLPQPNTILRSYGIQMAPDSAIYHLYEASTGVFRLGKLTDSDTVALATTYTPIAFTANPDFDALQFPSFAPRDSVLLSLTFTTEGTCANSPVSFYPTVKPAADSLRWSFGDDTRVTAWSPVHSYEEGGAFTVRAVAYLKGDSVVTTQNINITQFDIQIQLVQDTTACVCELPVNNGKTNQSGVACPADTSDDIQIEAQVQGGSPTFQWYGPGGILPTQTSATLRPDSAGYYYLVATVGACSAYAGVNVKEYDSLDQRANIWHFGQNAGIDFNGLPDDPPVAVRGPLNTPEGTSVISDRNGQVVFSTDGQSIYVRDPADATQFVDITPTPNPPGLGGQNTSSQSALIMPVPGDETLFYIFTTQEIQGSGTYELRYSLFDKKLNAGQGGLAEYNQLLFARSTERITGSDNWLIAHEYGNNSFRAFPISSNGIGSPVVSALGSDHSSAIAEQGQGYMELGARNILAVALSTPGTSNVVELFDFVDSTGMVTNFRTANLNSTTGQVYGLEISPGGNKLYATLKSPGTSQIVEFSIDSVGAPHFKQRVNQTGELGAMQVGPDGQIYVAINGSSNLGRFQANEDTTAVTALTNPLEAFALLAGTTSQLGLPNFTQIISNPISTPGFTVDGVCAGDSTTFSGTGKDAAIDKFYWTFGDGQSEIDGGAEIKHLYPDIAPGQPPVKYTVTLIIYNKCQPLPNGYAQFTKTITIFAPPADPTSAVNLCTTPLTLDANPPNAAGLTYLWSTEETTETIIVNRQALYDVTVTDVNGCTTDGQFLVADNRPQVELGPSVTICEETPIPPLNAQNPGADYLWELNDTPTGGTAQTQSVDATAPGVFEYKVTVTDPVSTCFALDSITYTINESPAWSASAITPPTTCTSNDGSFVITIFGPANTLFTYSVTGPTSAGAQDQTVGVLPTVTGLDGGVYGVTVSDQISGCATINTVSINDPAFSVIAPNAFGCDPITLNVSTSVPQAALAYRIIDANTLAVVESGNAPSSPFNTNAAGLPSNNQTYTVEVTAASCTASANAVVDEDPTVPITFSSLVCTDPISITANSTGTPTFAWTGPDIVNNTQNSATLQASPAPGTWTYNLIAEQPGVFCRLDTAITVIFDGVITPDFALPEPCADQAILSGGPIGPYTYRWYKNSVLLPGGGGQQIPVTAVADDGALYRLEVVNTVSGCIFPSAEKQINLDGDLQITLASTPPCQEAPFTITTTANGTSPVTIQWFRNGVLIPNQSGTSIVQTENGLYSVVVNRGQCQRTQDFNIILSPNPPSLLPESGIICPDPANLDPTTREVILDAGPNNVSYEWFKDGAATGITTQTFTATATGFYEVRMTNAFMCTNTEGITLREDCDPRITGPNAFRPGSSAVNDDGELSNQAFRLFTFFIADTDFQVFIFNRWGEMIFESSDRDFAWNGGYNNNIGKPLPPGTYSYVVRYKSSYRPAEGVKEKRGGVVLLR